VMDRDISWFDAVRESDGRNPEKKKGSKKQPRRSRLPAEVKDQLHKEDIQNRASNRREVSQDPFRPDLPNSSPEASAPATVIFNIV